MIWFRPFLRFRSGERFEVRLSLDGNSQGVVLVSEPLMPDFETLSELIPNSVKKVFGDALEVRGEDIMNALGGVSAIGESSVRIPAGIKARIDFQPKQDIPNTGEAV